MTGSRRVTLQLGELALAFDARCDAPRIPVAEAYLPFVTSRSPDFTFRIHKGRAPFLELGRAHFDSGVNWALHIVDGKPVIRIWTLRSDPHQIVVLEPDYEGGDIYCVGDQWQEQRLSPLGSPLEQLLMVNLLGQERGVLLHASAVIDGGEGILFNGMSGAGKSTMAGLWEGREWVTVLSDDRVIVREHHGRFWAYGTPWHGSARISAPEAVPLERIFLIHHAEGNTITRLGPTQAVSQVLARSFPPLWDAESTAFTLAFLERLVEAVPCHRLGFAPDESAVDFVRCVS